LLSLLDGVLINTLMDSLKKISKLLNMSNAEKDWFRYYGITERRKDSLLRDHTHPNSIFNSNSETSLTLFLLGNIDRWSQTSIGIETPRDKNSRWNLSFFEKLVECDEELTGFLKENSVWNSSRISDILGLSNFDMKKNIILFELELFNQVLHLGNRNSRDNISFLDISESGKWIQYDAVMILPKAKRFVFFESKFKSDVSTKSQNYSRINQMIKGLEAAHLITEYEKSPYQDWDFRYVIICPKLLDDYGLTRYNKTADSIGKYLVKYNDLLNNRYNGSVNHECYPELFESFIKETPEKISKLYWKDLGELLMDENQHFFADYFRELRKADFDPNRIAHLKKKLKGAGIRFNDKK